jgi:peptidase E
MTASPIRSRIDLIGGGPGTMLSLRRHLRSALAVAPRAKKPLVAYVGAASADNVGFQAMIGAVIASAGARVRGVKLASPHARVSAAQTLLEDCDVVFVSGGDVEAGMHVLEDRGVLPLFHALGRAGKPMIGISAGSIMLGRAWVRFPDDEEIARTGSRAPSVFPCMGLAPLCVDAHAEDDEWGELRVLLLLLALAGEAAVGHGLTRKGGIMVEPDARGARVTAFGTAAPRFIAQAGTVEEASPLALGASETIVIETPPPRRRAPAR